MEEQTLVSLSDYKKEFNVHTDVSDSHIGGTVSQEEVALAYFSRKLNKAQQTYLITQKDFLSIVEILNLFRTTLLVQQIVVWTYHTNLTYLNTQFISDCVLRQQLVLE